MKSLISSVVGSLIAHSVLVLLILSVVVENKSLAAIAVSANWVFVVLGWFVSAMCIILSHALMDGSYKGNKAEICKTLSVFTKKKGALRRLYGWLTFTVVLCLLAYSGWVVTAVIYALTSFIFTVCASIARDKINEYQAA